MNPELSKIPTSNIALSPLIAKALKNKTAKPLGERKKAVRRQELMVLLGNTCAVASGMAVSLPSAALPQLKNANDIYQFSTEESSWFASINTLICPIGSLFVGYLMDRLGRKNTMLLTNFVGALGWALLATSPYQSTRDAMFIQILIGRSVLGLMMGAAMAPIGSYAAEISLPRIRGRLIMGSSIAMSAGILAMYILGYFIRNQFQLICLIPAVFQCFGFCCVLPMPESPTWLLQNGKTEKARKALKYFRGLLANDNATYDEFERELALIKKTSEQSRTDAANESLLQAIKAREVYKPLVMLIGFFFFQQFSGIPIVIVFAAQIATSAGVAADPMMVAVLVGIARIITTFFMSTIFERWGRRPAGMLSAAGMTVCMLLLAANGWWPIIGESVALLPIICILVHIIFSTMGLLTLPMLMVSEVFPQRVRGSANGVTLFFGLTFGFLIIKLYPTIESLIGTSNSFLGFGLISLAAMVFIFFVVPETKGRSLLEIENYFRTGRRVTNAQVLRRQSLIAQEVAAGVFASQHELDEVILRLSKVHEICEPNDNE